MICSKVDIDKLPKNYPTHMHEPLFWESLGRVVGTFGHLEEVLKKAILIFTGTKEYSEDELEEDLIKWTLTLEKTLTNPLGNLIDSYGKSVREHPKSKIENIEDLLSQLKETAKIRNVICHSSWGLPNSQGATTPFFVNKKKEVFQTEVDALFLPQLQKDITKLIVEIINTVTYMGWQFPGTNGPGKLAF